MIYWRMFIVIIMVDSMVQPIVSSKNTDDCVKRNLLIQVKFGKLSLSNGRSLPIEVTPVTVKPNSVISARRPYGRSVIFSQVTPSTVNSNKYKQNSLIPGILSGDNRTPTKTSQLNNKSRKVQTSEDITDSNESNDVTSTASSKNRDDEIKRYVQIQFEPTLGRLSFTRGNTAPIVVTPITDKSSSERSAGRPFGRAFMLGQVTPNTINSDANKIKLNMEISLQNLRGGTGTNFKIVRFTDKVRD